MSQLSASIVVRAVAVCAFTALLAAGCTEREHPTVTPWGTPVEGDTVKTDGFTLSDIISNGELIMLTMSGPETYYDYHQHGMGLQYLLCEKFAQQIGVSLRVDVCKDTAEMVRKIQAGEGDIIAFPLPKAVKGVLFCGAGDSARHTQWAVRADNRSLADTLNRWFRPEMVAQVRKDESYLLSARSIVRHVYAPMLDRRGGVISRYDALFMQYAAVARVDWRLLAAQCYQESTFDPRAHSWAGACGLMQIMPSTAAHLGLSMGDIYEPHANIEAAARYLAELNGKFADVPAGERVWFVLASYNGGFNHIRDAMALARKHGRQPHRWSDVSLFVERLSTAAYYNDPVVANGYMRGYETVDYVARIRDRYAKYRGFAPSAGHGSAQPQKAKRHYRYK